MPFGRRNRGQQPPTPYGGPQPGWGPLPTPPTWGGQPQRFTRQPMPPDRRNQPNQGVTPGVVMLVLLVIAIGIVYAFTKGLF